MADLLKNMLNYDSLREVALAVQSVYPPFQVDAFLASTTDETWDDLELMARARKIAANLGAYLPADYAQALEILEKSLRGFPIAFFFPIFIETYGQNDEHWDLSVAALGRNTEYWSSELAVRPFIVRREEQMMTQMYAWSKSDNEHLRRLSSEGCRPALPWAMALNKYKKDPSPILPILTQLKTDPSEYVRRSVANNINDISKTHPDLVVALARDWFGKNAHTNWIIKHGCRTLLKKGNRDVLSLFGYEEVTSIKSTKFSLAETAVSIGGELTFSFEISTMETAKVRLEYGIDYVKANGKRNRKIFQISQLTLKKNEKKLYAKKHSFADLSTRKHYPGTHSITLIVNGSECSTLDFDVIS